MDDEDIVVNTATTIPSNLRKEADDLVDKWLNLSVNFNDVAKNQNAKSPSLTVRKRNRSGDGNVDVYKLDLLYHHIDVLMWWKLNATSFPSIAIMARVYLSRELTSCFQERVFSIGGYVSNRLRSCTDEDRAEKQLLGKANKNLCEQLRSEFPRNRK
eukprot:13820546-Ditylum_brightwellii.AAC.1